MTDPNLTLRRESPKSPGIHQIANWLNKWAVSETDNRRPQYVDLPKRQESCCSPNSRARPFCGRYQPEAKVRFNHHCSFAGEETQKILTLFFLVYCSITNTRILKCTNTRKKSPTPNRSYRSIFAFIKLFHHNKRKEVFHFTWFTKIATEIMKKSWHLRSVQEARGQACVRIQNGD